ncbi:isopentenyl-diphosphate delta-isomerase [Anseongella ginsenosidimutans]|uniref:Isopentenyl-diphosphate delta-isomerase n=1 Tax=Anseongella ginsenosidimutans TaxID=496056 RepID=A0A4R3KP38_9SPHI|nr:isopentenyl-diphosphate Delta-isomerase [Anseongella ginsenosidimutans]QEC53974.1 isopentenyl-diphosphate Delta-isomerase [Anseongella ginsenosidimutans]TCS86360.1 isopentenyl-diphosphate delta-isomerase [Anseongella ginsenosidimutans]
MREESLILVNEKDEVTGFGEKIDVHRKGLLHRAFSILIVNTQNELLLQKRADEKYHSAGLWANACCSHPLKGEETAAAAHRRLQEELGFDCSLEFAFKFIYRADFDNGLTEHELDHVFTGRYDGPVYPDPAEISEVKWIRAADLANSLSREPEAYAAWFRIIMERAGELKF